MFSSLSQYCEKLKDVTHETLSFPQPCENCKINSYPQNLEMVCVEETYLSNNQCEIYSDVDTCFSCRDGKFLSVDGTSCVSSCPSG